MLLVQFQPALYRGSMCSRIYKFWYDDRWPSALCDFRRCAVNANPRKSIKPFRKSTWGENFRITMMYLGSILGYVEGLVVRVLVWTWSWSEKVSYGCDIDMTGTREFGERPWDQMDLFHTSEAVSLRLSPQLYRIRPQIFPSFFVPFYPLVQFWCDGEDRSDSSYQVEECRKNGISYSFRISDSACESFEHLTL